MKNNNNKLIKKKDYQLNILVIVCICGYCSHKDLNMPLFIYVIEYDHM